MKSDRSDNKVTETNPTESEATSADGEIEPERIVDKVQVPDFARQPERDYFYKNRNEVGRLVTSSA